MREVTEELFRQYIEGATAARPTTQETKKRARRVAESPPPWFGMLRKHARRVRAHHMDAIRQSIALGLTRERSA